MAEQAPTSLTLSDWLNEQTIDSIVTLKSAITAYKSKKHKATSEALSQWLSDPAHSELCFQFLIKEFQRSKMHIHQACWFSTRQAKPGNRGHIQFSVNKIGLYLHRVAYWSKGLGDAQGDVSHLCNHAACCNPDHLVDESTLLNNHRKGCKVWVISAYSGVLTWLCNHKPFCFRWCADPRYSHLKMDYLNFIAEPEHENTAEACLLQNAEEGDEEEQ